MNKEHNVLEENSIIQSISEKLGLDTVVELEGYIGSSNQEVIRFHHDFSMTNYLEIQIKDILHAIDIPKDTQSRKRLFIRGSAKIRNISTSVTIANNIQPNIVESMTTANSIQPNFSQLAANTGEVIRDSIEIFIDRCSIFRQQINGLTFWIRALEQTNTDGNFDAAIASLRQDLEAAQRSLGACRRTPS